MDKENKDYFDSLAEKLEALGLDEESYVNQLSARLEPILGEEQAAPGEL